MYSNEVVLDQVLEKTEEQAHANSASDKEEQADANSASLEEEQACVNSASDEEEQARANSSSDEEEQATSSAEVSIFKVENVSTHVSECNPTLHQMLFMHRKCGPDQFVNI